MATRVAAYHPIKPVVDPFDQTPQQSLRSERYRMFEAGGDVFIFRTAINRDGKTETRCVRATPHGTIVLDVNAVEMLKKFEKDEK